MFQTYIDAYTEVVEEKIREYLSILPTPDMPVRDYLALKDLPNDNQCRALPMEWLDVAAATALIRTHKDTKAEYEVNAYMVEMLTVLFRCSVVSLGWMEDDEAYALSAILAYDKPIDTPERKILIHDFCHAMRLFPYRENLTHWYAYMAPLLAYTRQTAFEKPYYLTRYLSTIIDKFGLMTNRGEHAWDINTDVLKFQGNLSALLSTCRNDIVHKTKMEEYLRNVLAEYAKIWLAGMLQRSATVAAFGQIGQEIISYHYSQYQEISQKYKRLQETA